MIIKVVNLPVPKMASKEPIWIFPEAGEVTVVANPNPGPHGRDVNIQDEVS